MSFPTSLFTEGIVVTIFSLLRQRRSETLRLKRMTDCFQLLAAYPQLAFSTNDSGFLRFFLTESPVPATPGRFVF